MIPKGLCRYSSFKYSSAFLSTPGSHDRLSVIAASSSFFQNGSCRTSRASHTITPGQNRQISRTNERRLLRTLKMCALMRGLMRAPMLQSVARKRRIERETRYEVSEDAGPGGEYRSRAWLAFSI